MINSPLDVVRSSLPSLNGATILDAGCGDGGFAQALAAEGATVTGIDPNPKTIESARAGAPACRFDCGTAELLPYADASFDAVVFVNSLHHVPEALMDQALRESWRVLRPNGALIVLEPLASGGCFEALRHVEDETHIRRAAQDALLRVVATDIFTTSRTLSYTHREIFADCGAFLERIIRVDPARRAIVDANRAVIVDAILAVAQRLPDGKLVWDQPVKADILHAAKKV